jgi:hypothetical protein
LVKGTAAGTTGGWTARSLESVTSKMNETSQQGPRAETEPNGANLPKTVPAHRSWSTMWAGCKPMLSHPLFLLLIGAMISSLIVPVVTRIWQIHDKELEVKGEVIEQINGGLTDFVHEAEFRVLGTPGHTQEEFDDALLEWEVTRGQISTLLRIYYPDQDFARHWDRFSGGVIHFYELGDEQNPIRREQLARRLEGCFADPGELANLHNSDHEQWESEVQILVREIFMQKDQLVHDIVYTPSDLWDLRQHTEDASPPGDPC